MSKYLKAVISHMTSDPGAIDHAHIGAASCSVLMIMGIWLNLGEVFIVGTLLFGALICGICVEIVQRMERAADSETGEWLGHSGPHQKTARKSILDIIVTWWFLVTYYKLLKK